MSAPSDGARADARKRLAANDDLARALFDADHCHGIVYRDGDMDACGKRPVALIDARDIEDNCIWPACAYHANRYGRGQCVPIVDIVAAIKAVGR